MACMTLIILIIVANILFLVFLQKCGAKTVTETHQEKLCRFRPRRFIFCLFIEFSAR